MITSKRLLLTTGLFFIITTTVPASDFIRLNGNISDYESGKHLPGALIEIVGTHYNTRSDERGFFEIIFESESDTPSYKIKVTIPGYDRYEKTLDARANNLDIRLKPKNDLVFDRQDFSPPPKKGDIYVVVDKKQNPIVYIAVSWGPWQNSEQVNLSDYNGVVVHMKHLKDDSILLTFETDGKIVSIQQYQGGDRPDVTGYARRYW